jgi:hypothetical protein
VQHLASLHFMCLKFTDGTSLYFHYFHLWTLPWRLFSCCFTVACLFCMFNHNLKECLIIAPYTFLYIILFCNNTFSLSISCIEFWSSWSRELPLLVHSFCDTMDKLVMLMVPELET